MKEFRTIVDTYDLPASRRNKVSIRRWSRIRQEYQSRACRHQATISLKRGPQRFPRPNAHDPRHLSEPLESSHHEAIRSACLSLRMCLSYHNLSDSTNDSQQFSYLVPRDVTDSLGLDRRLHILMCQRLAESSHRLLTLLRCFQFGYMRSKNERLRFDQQYNIVGRRTYDSPTLVLRGESEESEDGPLDVRKAFYLPTVWGVEPSDVVEEGEAGEDEVGAEMLEVAQVWPESLLDLVGWITENKEAVDEVAVMTRMYDLVFVLEVAGWNVENDALRRWLRGLFPRIVDYPKLDELESSHQRTPTPTLMDLETFIMILLLQRHAICVVRGEARTMGQILYMTGQHGSIYSPSEGQVRFWRTCLCLFGRPTAQRKHYMGDMMTEREIKQCLREIRGEFVYEEYKYDAETVERQNYLYLALGVIYQNLIELHNMDCSIEAMHYLGVYEAWNARGGGTSNVVRGRWKETVDHELSFLVLDEKASDEEYKMLVRYNDDQTIASLHISSPLSSPATLAPALPDDDDNPFKVKPPPPILVNDIINPTILANYVLGVANTRHLFASSPKFDDRGRVSDYWRGSPEKGLANNTTPRKVVLHLRTRRGKKNKVITPARFGGWEEREGRDPVDFEDEDEDEDEDDEDDGAGGKGGKERFELVVEDPDGARTDIPIGNVQRSFWAELSIRRTVEAEDDRWLEEEVARGVLGREGDEETVPNEPLAVVLKRNVGYDDGGYVSMFGAWKERMEEREREEASKKLKAEEEKLLVQDNIEEKPVKVAAYMWPTTPTRHGLVDVGPLRFASPPPMAGSPSDSDSDGTQAVLRTWAIPNVNTSPRRRATAELPRVQPPPLLAPAPRAALFSWPPQRSNQFTGFNPAVPLSPPSSPRMYGHDNPVSPYVDSEEVSSEENVEEGEEDEGEYEDEISGEGNDSNSREGSDWSLMSDPDGRSFLRCINTYPIFSSPNTPELTPDAPAQTARYGQDVVAIVFDPVG
ncbi:hypothetical protein BC937DRAFT_89485 [Endogone sp. FLAS-F59071]|nr:hypothetical protein BC937DRAFT_89485 [Endogone sp. FLAS-F59071]|eukprot:RUS17793.1 hypothetical protein BC937DRAFT_89485 [Endogone sp. FLAS-F59071]